MLAGGRLMPRAEQGPCVELFDLVGMPLPLATCSRAPCLPYIVQMSAARCAATPTTPWQP